MTTRDDALSALQFLAAMYPLEGELELSPAAEAALEAAETGASNDEQSIDPLDVVVNVSLEDSDKFISVSISFSPELHIVPRQPYFLTRSAFETLSSGLAALTPSPDLTEALMTAIEYARTTAAALATEEEDVGAGEEAEEGADDGPLERVWFWLPSLSTREKRKDMVNYAPRYRLAGFVLAGKPALMCLEGGGKAVDRYMAAIKSESWGDIPSFQKKVTERLRLPLSPSDRKFTTMTDVTSQISHHGTYNHRVDMSDVKRLADSFGVGEDFNAAVMNSREA